MAAIFITKYSSQISVKKFAKYPNMRVIRCVGSFNQGNQKDDKQSDLDYRVNHGDSNYTLLKEVTCSWWKPDPRTGFWTPEGRSPHEVYLNTLDQQVWIRSEEA